MSCIPVLLLVISLQAGGLETNFDLSCAFFPGFYPAPPIVWSPSVWRIKLGGLLLF